MAKPLSNDDRNALKKAAEIAARQIVVNGTATVSRRIAAATRVVSRGSQVGVVVDGETAPMAAPFEAGEWHPLFGHREWTPRPGKSDHMPLRPFLTTARDQKADDMLEKYADSVYDYAKKRGFK
jgi:hypothetical protein